MRFKLQAWLLCCWFVKPISAATLLDDITQLSDASMQGRKTATAGSALAREYIARRYSELNLHHFVGGYQQSFVYSRLNQQTGINMVAMLPGCRYPQFYIAVTAHYDHLGRSGRKIYHGADDNASGVAAMLELAARLTQHCPAYSYLFIATDAEEDGLYGSKAFVAAPPVSLSSIVLNLNLDMISHPDKRGKLYLTGARRYPALIAKLEHDYPKLQFLHHRGPTRLPREHGRYDWPNASDHGPFHRAGIAYLFFGGQDHPHYHTPEDTWQRIEPGFLDMAMSAIWHTVQWLEQQTPTMLQTR